jgi:hypothetical protein
VALEMTEAHPQRLGGLLSRIREAGAVVECSHGDLGGGSSHREIWRAGPQIPSFAAARWGQAFASEPDGNIALPMAGTCVARRSESMTVYTPRRSGGSFASSAIPDTPPTGDHQGTDARGMQPACVRDPTDELSEMLDS